MMAWVVFCYLFYGCLGYLAINPIISGQTGFKALQLQIFSRNKRVAARISVVLLWPVWVLVVAVYGCYAMLKNLFKGFLQ